MKRREIIAGVIAVSWSVSAHAQTSAPPRPVRVAITTRQPRTANFLVAFQDRLRELGYVDGQNLVLEVRRVIGSDEGHLEAMREIVEWRPDILIAGGPEVALKAAITAAPTLPIVMIAVDYDPIALGYVQSLARPGGNITGVVFQQPELGMKRLQVMKEISPALTAATLFWDAASADQRREVRRAAVELGLELSDVEFRDQPYDYEAALISVPLAHRAALLVCVSPIFFRERQALAATAQRNRAATVFGLREFVDAGGLLSYGTSISGLYRRAADYVASVAQGTKPADLPVEQPTSFELIINLKTAKALGIAIPPSLLARADEVIE